MIADIQGAVAAEIAMEAVATLLVSGRTVAAIATAVIATGQIVT
jgi:hypothetical protein